MNDLPPNPPPTWKEALRLSLSIYLPMRVGLSLFVALLLWLVPALAMPPRIELMARWKIPLPTGPLADLFFTPWLRFDALWFMKTALGGYELAEPNIQHLPLYPLLMRALYTVIDGHIGLSALIISNGAFVLGLAYMYRLIRLDEPEAVARRAVLYLALFPTAFFYLVGYTESLFMVGAVGAFYYARQSRWLAAGLLGMICALSRPQGILLFLPLCLEFWQQAGYTWRQQWPKALPLLLLPLSVSFYALYLQLEFGLPAALKAYTAYWQVQAGSGWFIPLQGVWLSISTIWQGSHLLNNGLDLIFTLFGLMMTLWAIRSLRPAYWLFIVLNLGLVISKPIAEYPLLSTPRFILPLFPMYLLLARAGATSPLTHRLIVYSWLALLLFFSAQFAWGGWVA